MGKEKMYFVEDNAGARMLVWTNGQMTTVFDDNNTERLYAVENPQDYLEALIQNSTPECWERVEWTLETIQAEDPKLQILAVVEF